MSDEDNEVSEPRDAIPWISGIEAYNRFGKSAPVLRTLAKLKKIRSKKINGKELFSVEDLENLSDDDESQETSMADLVRAARDMLQQAQKHHETMFEKFMGGYDKLLHSYSDQLDKQNEHILNLEKQAIDMREAAEKVFNLEHTRKMDELKEERTRAMQTKAIDVLQKTLGPWLQQKLGGTAGAPTSESDDRFSQLGKAIVGAVISMDDEKFQSLEGILGPDEFSVLQMIRQGARS